MTFYKDDVIVGGGKSQDIFEYIEYMTEEYPEKLYKAVAINEKEYSPWTKEGDYNSLPL